MKKRLLKTSIAALTLAATLLITLIAVPAWADAISEPDSAFYNSHMEECRSVERIAYVNGPDTSTDFYLSPEDAQVVGTLKKGEEVTMKVTWKDKNGTTWVCAEYYDAASGFTGWIPMSYLCEKYSSRLFIDQYQDELTEHERKLSEEETTKDILWQGKILGYSYPGAKDGTPLDFAEMDETEGPVTEYDYVDAEGRTWSYLAYYMGRLERWICLDAPTAEWAELYPDGGPVVDKRVLENADADTTAGLTQETDSVLAMPTPEADPAIERLQKQSSSHAKLVGIAVAGVGVLAIILLLILRRLKK